jgi:hypothetical protein
MMPARLRAQLCNHTDRPQSLLFVGGNASGRTQQTRDRWPLYETTVFLLFGMTDNPLVYSSFSFVWYRQRCEQ